jgi:hypothetical protein
MNLQFYYKRQIKQEIRTLAKNNIGMKGKESIMPSEQSAVANTPRTSTPVSTAPRLPSEENRHPDILEKIGNPFFEEMLEESRLLAQQNRENAGESIIEFSIFEGSQVSRTPPLQPRWYSSTSTLSSEGLKKVILGKKSSGAPSTTEGPSGFAERTTKPLESIHLEESSPSPPGPAEASMLVRQLIQQTIWDTIEALQQTQLEQRLCSYSFGTQTSLSVVGTKARTTQTSPQARIVVGVQTTPLASSSEESDSREETPSQPSSTESHLPMSSMAIQVPSLEGENQSGEEQSDFSSSWANISQKLSDSKSFNNAQTSPTATSPEPTMDEVNLETSSEDTGREHEAAETPTHSASRGQ